MAEGELTPEQRIRLSETLTRRAQQCLTWLDRDKTESVRNASLLAQRAIEVLPREASVERSKAHYKAEKLLRELGTPRRPSPAEAVRMQRERLAKMWHPTLNGSKQFEDIPGASVGKYWWRCMEVDSHDRGRPAGGPVAVLPVDQDGPWPTAYQPASAPCVRASTRSRRHAVEPDERRQPPSLTAAVGGET